MNSDKAQFVGGSALVALAGALMLFTEGPIAAPITVLIVGLVLITTSRRSRALF